MLECGGNVYDNINKCLTAVTYLIHSSLQRVFVLRMHACFALSVPDNTSDIAFEQFIHLKTSTWDKTSNIDSYMRFVFL